MHEKVWQERGIFHFTAYIVCIPITLSKTEVSFQYSGVAVKKSATAVRGAGDFSRLRTQTSTIKLYDPCCCAGPPAHRLNPRS